MRLKMIVGNLLVVLGVGVGAFYLVRTDAQAASGALLDAQVERSAPLFSRSFALAARELVAHVEEQANSAALRGVFHSTEPERRQERAFAACETVESWFSDPARGRDGKPEIVVVTDAAGAVVARSSSVNLGIEEDVAAALPTLRAVLRDGVARHDVWDRSDSGLLLQVGMAPVRGGDGSVQGGLLVGYDLSNGVARAQAELLGGEVAFLAGERVYSSSLDSTSSGALQAVLFDPAGLGPHTATAMAGSATSPWRRTVGDRDLMGVTGKLPLASSAPVGFAVMEDRGPWLAPASAARWVLVLTTLGLVAVAIYGLMLALSLIRPIEDIEEAVLAIINGQTDLRIEVESAELGGLAYRINQLVNELTGTAEDSGDGVQRATGDGWDAVREDTGRTSTPPRSVPAPGAETPKPPEEPKE